jgi:uncharacterized protein involved in tolerance to divalent cations
MKTKFIYVTTASSNEAVRIAETVVTERLAACANIRKRPTGDPLVRFF